MRKLISQIFRFGIVGVVCTIIDFGVMIFLKEIVDVHYLFASGISFAVSVVILSLIHILRC